jgi:hypothetical protein
VVKLPPKHRQFQATAKINSRTELWIFDIPAATIAPSYFKVKNEGKGSIHGQSFTIGQFLPD